MRNPDESFDDFVMRSSPRLLRSTYLMVGDLGAAEDLLQDVLEKMYVRWSRVDDPAAYARQALSHAAAGRWRRRARRKEISLAEHHVAPAGDNTDARADRDLLMRALAQLPRGQRAVLVLRYFDDQTEAETAAALGCSVGTVKSQCARAMSRLRALLHADAEPNRSLA
jgi:RNA polymerase sigma-70 factor (sigma-E family)